MDQGRVQHLVLGLDHVHDQGQDLGRDQNLVRVQDLTRDQNHGLNPLCLKSRSVTELFLDLNNKFLLGK